MQVNNLFNNFGSFLSNNIYLALLISFLAGIVSSFSPCVLSTVPLIISYVNGNAKGNKKLALKYSLIFSFGLVFTLTSLGAISATFGFLLSGSGKWFYILLSILMIIVGLQIIGVIEIGNNFCRIPGKRGGVIGAFFLGILGGVLSSPCSTPILIAILAFVAEKGNVTLGILMLFLYSLGHCFLILLSGISVGFVESIGKSEKAASISKILKWILGILIIILGLYLFYLGV